MDKGKLKFSDLTFGFLNNVEDTSVDGSVDRRRSSTFDYLRGAVQQLYQKNTLEKVDSFKGIVMYAGEKNSKIVHDTEEELKAFAKMSLFENILARVKQKMKSKINVPLFKVYIPELECRPAPTSFKDPLIETYFNVRVSSRIKKGAHPVLGSQVVVKFENLNNFWNPEIIEVGETIAFAEEDAEAAAAQHDAGTPSPRGAGGQGGSSQDTTDEQCPDSSASTPNADKVRSTMRRLGYREKGSELSNGGDLSSKMADVTVSVLEAISSAMPNVKITLTGGNDCYHQKLSYTSRHKLGNAMDIAISPSSEPNLDKVVSILMQFAAGNSAFRFIDEYRGLTAAGTGGHFHMSWGEGSEAASTSRTARLMAQNGEITPIQV